MVQYSLVRWRCKLLSGLDFGLPSCRRPSSTTTRIETRSQGPFLLPRDIVDDLHPQQQGLKPSRSIVPDPITEVDDLHPQQQGLKHIRDSECRCPRECRRPSSTTTRIETDGRAGELIRDRRRRPSSTTTRIETIWGRLRSGFRGRRRPSSTTTRIETERPRSPDGPSRLVDDLHPQQQGLKLYYEQPVTKFFERVDDLHPQQQGLKPE